VSTFERDVKFYSLIISMLNIRYYMLGCDLPVVVCIWWLVAGVDCGFIIHV